MNAAAAQATDLPVSTMVLAGTTNSTAAVVAAGALIPGDAVTCLGSTLVLKIIGQDPIAAPRYGVYSHRFGTRWLIGGASNSGGAVLRRYFDDGEIRRLSATLDPDRPIGLDYYPLPAPSERFPTHDPALQPRLGPRPADDGRFLQGLLEGIARIETAGYRFLHRLGAPPPNRVLTTGGGAENAGWSEIRKRYLGGSGRTGPAPGGGLWSGNHRPDGRYSRLRRGKLLHHFYIEHGLVSLWHSHAASCICR